jgi:hypothetical protein
MGAGEGRQDGDFEVVAAFSAGKAAVLRVAVQWRRAEFDAGVDTDSRQGEGQFRSVIASALYGWSSAQAFTDPRGFALFLRHSFGVCSQERIDTDAETTIDLMGGR